MSEPDDAHADSPACGARPRGRWRPKPITPSSLPLMSCASGGYGSRRAQPPLRESRPRTPRAARASEMMIAIVRSATSGVEDLGRVADRDAVPRGRLDVDVVVADGVLRDDAQAGHGREELLAEVEARRADGSVRALQRSDQLSERRQRVDMHDLGHRGEVLRGEVVLELCGDADRGAAHGARTPRRAGRPGSRTAPSRAIRLGRSLQ